MTSDRIKKLATNTNLSVGEVELLLENRRLSGDPEEHDESVVFVTENEVVVDTSGVFSSYDTNSAVELALKTGADVSTVREGDDF